MRRHSTIRDDERIRSQRVVDLYLKAQINRTPQRVATQAELDEHKTSWQADDIPGLQRTVVDEQLRQMRAGANVPVFDELVRVLKEVPLPSFRLLDAGCASGYYSEVISTLLDREILYHGCDYSESMVAAAKNNHPGNEFSVGSITDLPFQPRSFDVVLASGVLEHIPDFGKAIEEICRVSNQFVLVHRLPTTTQTQNVSTLGTQYSIVTPRILFNQESFIESFQRQGYQANLATPLSPLVGVKTASLLFERVKNP